VSDLGHGGASRPPVRSGSARDSRATRPGGDVGTQARTLALVGKRRPRLRLLPPELAPLSEERERAARGALRALYRDFLETGGLDSLADRRSHAAPARQERKAA
jgi:hypothetical protein